MPNEEDFPFQFKRRLFPIKLAFSMTVNKSQGQKIKKIGFFVDAPLFNHGQLYTVSVPIFRIGSDSDRINRINSAYEK
jgi:hypothetical protein